MEADESPILSEVITEDMEKYEQVRLVLQEFRGQQYLHVRKYYLDFEGEWMPTKTGICFVVTLDSVYSMFISLVKMLADSEVLHALLEHGDADELERIFSGRKEESENG